MKRNHRLLFMSGLCLALLFWGGCFGGDPRPADVERVKNDFLSMRLNATFIEQLRGKSDIELFRMSCSRNYVNCDRVLVMLQESDPDFYGVLTGSKEGQ